MSEACAPAWVIKLLMSKAQPLFSQCMPAKCASAQARKSANVKKYRSGLSARQKHACSTCSCPGPAASTTRSSSGASCAASSISSKSTSSRSSSPPSASSPVFTWCTQSVWWRHWLQQRGLSRLCLAVSQQDSCPKSQLSCSIHVLELMHSAHMRQHAPHTLSAAAGNVEACEHTDTCQAEADPANMRLYETA